jgi:hypothetical protein
VDAGKERSQVALSLVSGTIRRAIRGTSPKGMQFSLQGRMRIQLGKKKEYKTDRIEIKLERGR